MMQGQVEAVSVKPFVSKAGNAMFKVGYKIDGAWYNTVSKFADQRIKKGDEVFFETQTQYPDSIVTGTLKVINGAFTPKKAPAVTGQTILAKDYEKKIAELTRKLKEFEDEALLKELNDEFNDKIPF